MNTKRIDMLINILNYSLIKKINSIYRIQGAIKGY